MENTGKVKNRTMMTLAILFISALEMGGMGLQPALAAIQESFPDVSATVIQTMSNFPGFAMLIGCVISTLLATRFSKKVLCQFGVACYAAIAVLGFFFHGSIVLLFAWQIVLGLGFGFLMPTSNGIIAENYNEQQRGAIMGIQNTFTNGGGIYLTFVGGFLASIDWHYTYLAYLFGLIPLILGCIYLPNDKPAAKGTKQGGGYLNVSKKTWMYGVIIFLFLHRVRLQCVLCHLRPRARFLRHDRYRHEHLPRGRHAGRPALQPHRAQAARLYLLHSLPAAHGRLPHSLLRPVPDRRICRRSGHRTVHGLCHAHRPARLHQLQHG